MRTTDAPASTATETHTEPPGKPLDIVGIGFGPANLSLAIAIEEHNASVQQTDRISSRFIEQHPRFTWHDGMLLPGATMQISYLKDLVTLRAPMSSYSFVNYLHVHDRLVDFVNLKTFTPTRQEFHDYLSWCANRVSVPVSYGNRAAQIDAAPDGFTVHTTDEHGDGHPITARNVVLGLGISASLPDGVTAGQRVFHNHHLLDRLATLPSRPNRRFLVIGAGQSAAEATAYLHQTYPDAEVHTSFRRFGYTPADSTPYANRIFDPDAVDEFYRAPAAIKERLMSYHRLTNYSAVDEELINELYRREYDETVRGTQRLFMHRVTELDTLEEREDGVRAVLRDLADTDGGRIAIDADAVVFGTGFTSPDVGALLGPNTDTSGAFTDTQPVVGRDYGLQLQHRAGRIYLNGGVQHTHGLTSSLLSNLAIRARDILTAATQPMAQPAR